VWKKISDHNNRAMNADEVFEFDSQDCNYYEQSGAILELGVFKRIVILKPCLFFTIRLSAALLRSFY
jgi:hypothetical protein